ncbi:MAG: hypothetical protein KDB27_33040 [Planctomycetales bacterium]|nr:hypothetical protein [Planctomycetales bacterium]
MRLEQGGSQTYATRLDWHANLPSKLARENGLKEIKSFLGNRDQKWDVVLVGHSRGGVLAANIANGLKGAKNLAKTHLIMLDPTAAIPFGDAPILKIGGHVGHAVSYDDGQDFLMGIPFLFGQHVDVTMDGAVIKGAKTIPVETRGSKSHGAVAQTWYPDSQRLIDDVDSILAAKSAAKWLGRIDVWNGMDEPDDEYQFDKKWMAPRPSNASLLADGYLRYENGQLDVGYNYLGSGASVSIGAEGIGGSVTTAGVGGAAVHVDETGISGAVNVFGFGVSGDTSTGKLDVTVPIKF